MKRAALASLGVLLIAWLSFAVYPGHTYLAGRSQLYLPILQRLAAPGFLSRDLVATFPNVTYTAYDEITLFLRTLGGFDFRAVLQAQSLLCRLAAVSGAFLLSRAAGLPRPAALLASAIVNAGSFLPGLNQPLLDPEPLPGAFAFSFTLLAAGLLAREKPLLAGMFGGIAALYDPLLAAPFWIVTIVAFICDRPLRKLLRPLFPVLLVFILLLANLAQLQPATADADSGSLFSQLSPQVIQILRFRLPELWVSLWNSRQVHLYLVLFVTGMWAVTRIWPLLNRQSRWLFAALPLAGLLSLPLSCLLLDHFHFAIITQVRPLRTLLFTVALSWLACALAGLQALASKHHREALSWLAVCAVILALGLLRRPLPQPARPVSYLVAWAEANTWGSSMFLFPDAAHQLYPGVFRAESRRALWVDWESGAQSGYYPQFAREWWTRWNSTMQTPQFDSQLHQLLTLPVDYFVFDRDRPLELANGGHRHTVRPVFSDTDFVVYDASDLRFKPGRFSRLAAH